MNRQRGYQSRTQSKSSGIEVSGVLQRRGLVRSASEPTVQREEETKNHSWQESPLVKNFKSVPVRSASPFPIQPKLKVNPVLQKYDRGAERGSYLGHPANKTDLPNNLKAGIENLSGFSMDDVKVHYNSSKPAQLQALAYTQGTNIHVGPGQEKHLPHEAWHVVQQKQGRVKATVRANGVKINEEQSLEREADVMGAKAKGVWRSASVNRGVSEEKVRGVIQCTKAKPTYHYSRLGDAFDNLKNALGVSQGQLDKYNDWSTSVDQELQKEYSKNQRDKLLDNTKKKSTNIYGQATGPWLEINAWTVKSGVIEGPGGSKGADVLKYTRERTKQAKEVKSVVDKESLKKNLAKAASQIEAGNRIELTWKAEWKNFPKIPLTWESEQTINNNKQKYKFRLVNKSETQKKKDLGSAFVTLFKWDAQKNELAGGKEEVLLIWAG